jgi:hypothetical protein
MADKNPFDVELPKKSSNPFDVDIPIEKKNSVQPVLPTGTQPSKRGFEPFQSQVDTKPAPYVKPKVKPKNISEAVEDDNNYLGAIYNNLIGAGSDFIGGFTRLVAKSNPYGSPVLAATADVLGNKAEQVVEKLRSSSSSKQYEEKIQQGFDLTKGVFTKENAKALPLMISRFAGDLGLAIPTAGASYLAQGYNQGLKEFDKAVDNRTTDDPVWLNNASTPSSEADVRAFSFDVIPSNAIDRILIFKTPAPELPADFAGAAIQIFTKSNADENGISFSYTTGFNNQATFNKNYETYSGSKTDWLGFDNGLRNLPSNYPVDKNAMATLADNPSDVSKQLINSIGKSFNKNWTTYNNAPGPNQSFNFSYSKRFLLGKVSVGNFTSLTYNNSNTFFNAEKFAYDGYDVKNEVPFYRHQFLDTRSTNNVRLGALMNWLFIFGKNQKIEFRNILNQSGKNIQIAELELIMDPQQDFCKRNYSIKVASPIQVN